MRSGRGGQWGDARDGCVVGWVKNIRDRSRIALCRVLGARGRGGGRTRLLLQDFDCG